MKSRGFTLMEMMIAVAIVLVLAGVTYPIASNSIAKSRQLSCLANLRSIGVAMESYLQDHNRRMPVLESARPSKQSDIPVLETAFASYLPDPEAFHCPADHKVFKKTGSSYGWNSVMSGQPANSLSFLGVDGRPDKIPLVADKEAWHAKPKGSNILYADLSASTELRFSTGP